jgi:hypothetical protein
LYIAADGARANHPTDSENCKQVREIVSQIDWPCEAHFLFRDSNLGCGKGVSAAINWFFEHVEQGIILEDDCYPADDFFPFMESLLDKYTHNDRVMMISGNNFQQGQQRSPYSYFFSRACHIWGWATWRRAWQHYDFEMQTYARFKEDQVLENILDNPDEVRHWHSLFEKMARKEIDTWDYQWVYSVLAQDGLSVYPEVNLVSNIGFGEQATHTREAEHALANMPTAALGQIKHPAFIFPNKQADAFTAQAIVKVKPSRSQRAREKKPVYRLLKKWLARYE